MLFSKIYKLKKGTPNRNNAHSGYSHEQDCEHLGEEDSVHWLSQPDPNLGNQINPANKCVFQVFIGCSIFPCAVEDKQDIWKMQFLFSRPGLSVEK